MRLYKRKLLAAVIGSVVILSSGCDSAAKKEDTAVQLNNDTQPAKNEDTAVSDKNTQVVKDVQANDSKQSNEPKQVTSQVISASSQPATAQKSFSSTATVITPPVIMYPADKQVIYPKNPLVVRWKAISGVTNYTLQLIDHSGNTTEFNIRNGASYSIPVDKIPNALYRIRVAAIKGGTYWSKDVEVSFINDGSLFFLEAPRADNVPANQDLVIKWSYGYGGKFLGYYNIIVKDISDSRKVSPMLVDTYVDGDARSYTLPHSLLEQGHRYELQLSSVNTKDFTDPNTVRYYTQSGMMVDFTAVK